jgi:hypothetical protein
LRIVLSVFKLHFAFAAHIFEVTRPARFNRSRV